MNKSQRVKIGCAAWNVDHPVVHYIRLNSQMVKGAISVDSALMLTESRVINYSK